MRPPFPLAVTRIPLAAVFDERRAVLRRRNNDRAD
jgi:hypothetical protein